MCNTDQIIVEIDSLKNIVLMCRAFFPALDKQLIGKKGLLSTADFYRFQGYDVTLQFREPITQNLITTYSCIGKMVNENAIIRLYGIMVYYGIITENKKDKKNKIDENINGCEEVNMMRRMRHAFTKTKLNYCPNDSENIRLRQRLIDYFKLKEVDFAKGEIPTPIDKVILPIFEGCRKYVIGKTLVGATH